LHPSGGSQPTFGVTPGQLALARLLHQHPAVVPIPGTPAHIDENLAAAHIDLDEGTLADIDRLLAVALRVGGVL
jgi:aryl-alcohol dehydrogenase-like predicted oxidoreductase